MATFDGPTEAYDKLSPAVVEVVAAADAESDEEPLEVVVELQRVPMPDRGTRREKIDALRSAFEAVAVDVRRAIADVGGEVTGEAWINQTMRATVPTSALLRIAAEAVVVAIDRPRDLHADESSREAGETSAL